MLNRILEPEVMDTPEEARDYDAMDHAAVNARFVADFLAAWPEAAEEEPEGEAETGDDLPLLRVLDLGTGTARIPVELCRRAPQRVRVLAVDQAVNMLDLARYNLEVAGMTQRIQLAQADAKQLPYSAKAFDAVISNSIVHHIPEPAAVLAEAVRVIRPAGLLFFRDLVRPADEAQWKHLVETYAAGEGEHARHMFADSLRAALSLEEVRGLVVQLGFSALGVQLTSDRHWTWSARA